MSNEFQSMVMEESEAYTRMDKKPANGKLKPLWLLAAAILIIMIVMVFVVFCYQQRKFADLENSMRNQNCSLKFEMNAGSELDKNTAELKNLVSTLNLTLSTSTTNNQLNNGAQTKTLSDIQTLIHNLSSSLSTKLETKLQDMNNHQESRHTELNNLLQGLKVSVSELTAQLQNAGAQTKTLSDIQTSMNTLSSSLSSLSTKLETKLQDMDSQKKMLSEINTSVSKLTSSVNSLSSKLQNTDDQVMTFLFDLSDLKTELENSNKTTPRCKTGWIPFQSKCYFFSQYLKNWDGARNYCRNENGILAKVETEEEMNFLTLNRKDYWVGLTDETTGEWRWDDGSPFVRNSDWWDEGQPDNWEGHGLGGGEDCAHLTVNRKLNDNHCSLQMRYICQI